MKCPPRAFVALLVATSAAGALGACHRSTVAAIPVTAPDGAPATPPPAAVHDADTSRARRGYVMADVRFMHHMIMHHAQALAMTALVPTHEASERVRTVAERITVSQRDEIGLMQRWLKARGEMVPDATPDHVQHMQHMQQMEHGTMSGMSMHDSTHAAMMMSMPGMATPAEMAQLDAARGAAFDSLFVRLMIRHHEGALTMVKDYLATPGAAQEPEIFRFASDVDADQRAEIRRMQALLQ